MRGGGGESVGVCGRVEGGRVRHVLVRERQSRVRSVRRRVW